MGGFKNYLTTKLGNLVVAAIQSPNFVSGSAGWQIARDGSAEFNNVVARGSLAASGSGGSVDISGEQINFGNGAYISDSGTGQLVIGGNPGVNAVELNLPFSTTIDITEPGTGATAETWHKITSGFPAGVSGQIAYRLLPDNWVGLDFQLTVTSGTSIGGGTYFASLPSAYYPSAAKMYDVQALEGSNWVPVSFDIDTGGNIHARNAGVTTITQLTGNARYPLGV